MHKYQDLRNKKVGHLTVLELSTDRFDSNGTTKLWKCKCDCGNIIYKSARSLNEAKKKNMNIACGCHNWKDLTGKMFGDLTAVRVVRDENGKRKWECMCKCGDILYRDITYIQRFPYKCVRDSMAYNKYRNKIKNVLWRMKARCYNKNNKSYKYYGEKGVKVFDEWLKNSDSFVDWAILNGYKEGLEIDRIDVNGDYEPNNCRWVDNFTQANNKSNNIMVTYNGDTFSLRKWCRILQLPYRKTHKRYVTLKWDIERCFAIKERVGFK